MFHKCGEYNLSANKQTTVIDCHCELQTNKLDSTGKQQTNSLLRGCTTANYQYIFYCFTFTITCNYRVPSHIYYTALRRVVLVLIRLPGLGSLTPSLASVLKMAHRMNHNQVESVVCNMYSVYTMCAI